MEILQQILSNGVAISALGTALCFIGATFRYFFERRESNFWKEFNIYHDLIKQLVEPENEKKNLYIDRQAAVIFELRNFKRYHNLSLRMLKDKLSNSFNKNEYHRLQIEAQNTIDYIEKKSTSKCWLR
jgi:hypothetical protein